MKRRLNSLGLVAIGFIMGVCLPVGIESLVLKKWEAEGHGIRVALDSQGYTVGIKLPDYQTDDERVTLAVAEGNWEREGNKKCLPYMLYANDRPAFMSLTCPWIPDIEIVPEKPNKPNGKETTG